MKIYVASSWRNEEQPGVVKALREGGHAVYDFKKPGKSGKGFNWTEISAGWKQWKPRTYVEALEHDAAIKGFERDMDALRAADLVVLVLPCGTSAHLEAGWAVGCGKPVAIFYDSDYSFPYKHEPELMYKMATGIVFGLDELKLWVKGYAAAQGDVRHLVNAATQEG